MGGVTVSVVALHSPRTGRDMGPLVRPGAAPDSQWGITGRQRPAEATAVTTADLAAQPIYGDGPSEVEILGHELLGRPSGPGRRYPEPCQQTKSSQAR